MTQFVFNKEKLFVQEKAIYESYPTDVSSMEKILDQLNRENPDVSPVRRKTWVYQVASKHASLKLFSASPFYSEIDTGRDQNSVTSTFPPQKGIGCWLMRQYPDFIRKYQEWEKQYSDIQLLRGSSFTDTAHHYANCETVIQYGFLGIKKLAEQRLVQAKEERDDNGADFLTCVIEICDATVEISRRFAELAVEMLQSETDPAASENLSRIASVAVRVPANPPENFYEVLETIWFTREICNALDGLGFAVIGHIDRLVQPFYEKELKEGTITPKEAQDLISCFLAQTDARWNLSVELPGGTNADVIIGGCDREGKLIFNDVTKMILNSFLKYRFVNPKLQARVCSEHPTEYFELLGKLAGSGLNVLSVFNDEVIITANQKRGKDLDDCRLYQAGGCQELVVDQEVNCRAYVYINLPQMLQPSLFPEKWEKIYQTEQLRFFPAWKAKSYEEFYRFFLMNLRIQTEALARRYSFFGSQWRIINPAPLFSATMKTCLEQAKDVSEGGAKYNTDCFAATGLGILVDSLYSIYYAVYTRKIVSMENLRSAMTDDFSNHEQLRQLLCNKVPKFCRETEVSIFGGRVMKDIAVCLGGMPNGRKGVFDASLFAFYSYNWFKDETCSMPNGRRKGTALSRGTNPSENTDRIDMATLLDALKYLDFKDYPGGGVMYMDLPIMQNDPQFSMFSSVIRMFVENGGCIMDFNVVNRKQLEDAQGDPENHRNIVVRVCGYSAYFHTLNREMQDEVIARVQR